MLVLKKEILSKRNPYCKHGIITVIWEGQLFFIIKDTSKGTLISDTLRNWDSIAVAHLFEDLAAGK